MSHLEIIKEAYDKCGIKYKVYSSANGPYEYLILVGEYDEDFDGLTCDQAIKEIGHFLEFENGRIVSY